MKVKSYYKEVLNTLANIRESRDDDRFLTVCIWKNYNASNVANIDGRDYVSLKDIVQTLPHSDSIERARRVIQNDLGLYPPTTWKIASKRRMARDIWEDEHRHSISQADAQKMLDIYLKEK